MRLHVVQHGRLRDRAVITLRDAYLTRFRRYGSLTVHEREPRGEAGIWPEVRAWRVLVDERGEAWSSLELAQRLERWAMQHGDIAFAIGAAEGHDPATRARADCLWSLSRLVLPHQLAHLLVVEQCYRAASVLAGDPYHKA